VVRGWVGLGVGPFAQRSLDEALGFAVCLGRIRLGPDVLEAEIAAGGAEDLGTIAGAIVGHHAGNRDAEVRVVGDCGLEEGDRALLLLVRKDLREGHPGGVVDADVDELPPDAPALEAFLAGLRTAWTRPSAANAPAPPEGLAERNGAGAGVRHRGVTYARSGAGTRLCASVSVGNIGVRQRTISSGAFLREATRMPELLRLNADQVLRHAC